MVLLLYIEEIIIGKNCFSKKRLERKGLATYWKDIWIRKKKYCKR
jgi:hypothetical protein